MNRKGFTLVELITTFALTAVIVTILVNVSVIIRNMYNKADIKTHLLIEQANLSNALNTKISKKELTDYSSCTGYNFCYNFVFSDGSTEKLIIEDTYIKFGSYVYKLNNGTEVGTPSINKEAVSQESSDSEFLVLRIPIVNKLYPNEDFGINLVYQYNLIYITKPWIEPIILAATEKNKTFSGKIPSGNFESGDEYIINVDGSNKYHFYVLSTEGDKVSLLMSNNICNDGTLATSENTCLVAWYQTSQSNLYGPKTAFDYLYQTTKNWTNVDDIQMNYTDEGNTGSYGYGGVKTDGNITKITNKDGSIVSSYNNLKARLPKNSELEGVGCKKNSISSCPDWMSTGLKTSSYSSVQTEDKIAGIGGYWSLSSGSANAKYAISVGFNEYSMVYDVNSTTLNGIRPVIEISKSKF